MKSTGTLSLTVTINNNETLAEAVVHVGCNVSGVNIVGETPESAKLAIKDILLKDLSTLVDQVFDSLGVASTSMKLTCHHCGKEFLAEFPDGLPLLIACPVPSCGLTIPTEEFEEVL